MVKMLVFERNLYATPFYSPDDDASGGGDDDKGGNQDADKGDDDKNVADDAKLAKMSPAELLEFSRDMRDQKRVAQGAESVLRKERNVLRDEKAAQEKKIADAEKTTADKLTEANTTIEALKAERKSMGLKQSATTDLMKEGYPLDIIEVGLGGLTDENSKDTIAAFKKKFESYKADPKKKPDATAHIHKKPDGSVQPSAPHSVATAAMGELNKHGR